MSVNSSISDISNYSFSVQSKQKSIVQDAGKLSSVKIPIPPFLVSRGKPMKDPLPVEVLRNNKMKDSSSYNNYNYYDSDTR